MRIRFLGTGTSHGVPVIGCGCAVCTSALPQNARFRSSILIEHGDARIVIDTTPEFRLQSLAAGLTRLDAVLLTHAHADHINGLDDVRIFTSRTGAAMPIYGSAGTLAEVAQRFAYAFRSGQEGGGKPKLQLVAVEDRFAVAGLDVTPLPVLHGGLVVTAFCIRDPGGGHIVYATDCNEIEPSVLDRMRGPDLLVLDALSPKRHPTHFSLPQAVDVARAAGARRTLFTHVGHELEHRTANEQLPAGMALAYDGQLVDI